MVADIVGLVVAVWLAFFVKPFCAVLGVCS